LKLKARQFVQDYVHACLVNGQPVVSFTPDSHWFRRWEAEYGLSMRRANRKYAVPRRIVKERLEILWVVLFRIRYFISLVFGYDPVIDNWDQSPFHNNETGSQNKPILAVRGTIVPVVEGNSDVKCRWTANLTTTSQFTTGTMPPAECMFKAEKDGRTDKRLQEFIRSRGFPPWFSVTVAPKGSYREYDVIRFLEKHLEPWTDGRDWRIILCDDYSAHKSPNVWNLCWSRGYIRLCHGGGVTLVAQTPDTDLNEHVRRRYGNVEASMLLEKMRHGQVVPKLTQEECMEVMFRVLSDPELHKSASAGFKKVGQSIGLHGAEDALICREAGVFWNEETTDTYSSMRPKIDAELATVASEFASGGIAWSEGDVKRLIMEYPPRPAVDRILDNLGEDFYHDAIHDIPDCDVVGDDDAVSECSDDIDNCDADGGLSSDGMAAVAGDDVPSVEAVAIECSPGQADAAHRVHSTIAGLHETIGALQPMGSVEGVQAIQHVLTKERRKARSLAADSPAVADSFLRLRKADDDITLERKRSFDDMKHTQRATKKALLDRDVALAALRDATKKIHDAEGVVACKHAFKHYTLEMLGAGSPNAGGAKAKKNRLEVFDKLARLGAGLSAGQKNDWAWFREEWDKAMVVTHGVAWASVFASWMQKLLDDEDTNAFSKFMFSETCRVFKDLAALSVPGI
jgi:hypothetical protein